jgi:hypothetical protein
LEQIKKPSKLSIGITDWVKPSKLGLLNQCKYKKTLHSFAGIKSTPETSLDNAASSNEPIFTSYFFKYLNNRLQRYNKKIFIRIM